MTCSYFKLLKVCDILWPVWHCFGAAPFSSPNAISLLHLWKSMLQTLGTPSTILIPETCFHLHLHVYMTQWMVGKWFWLILPKSSTFRLRSHEEKMFIAFWRCLRRNNFNSNAVLKRSVGRAKDRCGIGWCRFSLAEADKHWNWPHSWLVLWDGPGCDLSPLKKGDLGNWKVTNMSTCRRWLSSACWVQRQLRFSQSAMECRHGQIDRSQMFWFQILSWTRNGMTMHPWHCIALVYLPADRGAMCFDCKRSSPGAFECPLVLSDQVGAVAKGSGLFLRWNCVRSAEISWDWQIPNVDIFRLMYYTWVLRIEMVGGV